MAHVPSRAMRIRSTTCRRRRPSSGSSPSSCSRCSTSSGSGGSTGHAGAAARSTRTARAARPHAGSCSSRSAGRPESRRYPGLPRPHRLAVQVAALSRPSHGFESRWGHDASLRSLHGGTRFPRGPLLFFVLTAGRVTAARNKFRSAMRGVSPMRAARRRTPRLRRRRARCVPGARRTFPALPRSGRCLPGL